MLLIEFCMVCFVKFMFIVWLVFMMSVLIVSTFESYSKSITSSVFFRFVKVCFS